MTDYVEDAERDAILQKLAQLPENKVSSSDSIFSMLTDLLFSIR